MSTPSKVDFKVVLLGQERVGKTCIMQRFLYGRYREQSPVCLLLFLGVLPQAFFFFFCSLSRDCDTDRWRCIWRKADAEHQEPYWRVHARSLGLLIPPFLSLFVLSFTHHGLACDNATGHSRV